MLTAVLTLAALLIGTAGALADKQVQAQPNNRFAGDVTMDQGENLTFQNNDLSTHNVTAVDNGSDGKPLFASPNTSTGQTTKVDGAQFLTTGNYKFECTIHPFMTGTLTVTSNGTPQPRPGGGPPSGGGGGGASDTTAPTLSLKVGSSKAAAAAKKKKLAVTVKVDEASTVSLTAKAGKTKVASGKVTLTAAGSKAVQLSLTKKGRALLARGRSVKITVSGAAVDAAGNRGTARTSAKLH